LTQEPDAGLAGFLAALDKLPPYDGITFRGLALGEVAPESTTVTANVMASSRNPRVATENFTSAATLAVLNHTGRDISALSAHPDEAEIVLLPGTMWRHLMWLDLPSPAIRVHVLEQLDLSGGSHPQVSWGTSLDDVQERITRAIQVAAAREPVEVHIPGKFNGPWITEPPTES
jgi:hypothetical protein